MNENYTPTTEQVFEVALLGAMDAAKYNGVELDSEGFKAQLYRWLARHDAEVAAKTLRDAATSMRANKDPGHWNLRDEEFPADRSQSPDVWLERRADRIEQEVTAK